MLGKRLRKAAFALRTGGVRGLMGRVGSALINLSQRGGGGPPLAPNIPTIIDIGDSDLDWLMPAVGGWLQRGNLYCFDYALRRLPPGTAILEIGSFTGLSTTILLTYRARIGASNPLFTCDRWNLADAGSQGLGPQGLVPATDYDAFIKDSFIRNVRFFGRGELPSTIELWSDDFFAAWRAGRELVDVFGRPARLGGPLGFVFIDGNHRYDFARRDFDNTDEFLAPGGFVLLDDSADAFGLDPARLAREIARRPDYELIIKNPNYLFRKRSPEANQTSH